MTVTALIAIAVLLLGLLAWMRRNAGAERTSRPRALADAELVYMEQLFRIRHPIRLVAKVDRVYRLRDGSLVLVELKTRNRDRVHLTDVIQLSAQRLAIEAQTGAVVELYAFVSVLGPGGKIRSHRVRLLDEAALVELYRRREAVRSGQLSPSYAASESACRNCGLRYKCDRFAGRG